MNKEKISTGLGFVAAFCSLFAFAISMTLYEIELNTNKSYTYFYQMIRDLDANSISLVISIANLLAISGIIAGSISFFMNKKVWPLTMLTLGLGFAAFFIKMATLFLVVFSISALFTALFFMFKSKQK